MRFCKHMDSRGTPVFRFPVNGNRRAAIGSGHLNLRPVVLNFHRALKKHLLNSDESLKQVGLRCRILTLGPCLFFIFRTTGSAVGVFATRTHDVLGGGEPDVLIRIRKFPGRRLGELKLQESSFLHVGMELAQESEFPAALTQDEFATNLQALPTSPQLWAARQEMPSIGDVKLCQCTHGELSWLATVSRPDIRARLARIASRVNSLLGSDVY